MEYLASHDIAQKFAAKTLIIPGNADLAKEGVPFETDSQLAKDALNVFLAQVPTINPQGYLLNGFHYNTALFNAIRDRLTQAMTGELTLDEAIARAQDDVDKAMEPTPAPTAEATAAA
jgi:alpha-1,4-digalacturonate transport system substrate-binding protein